MEHLYYSKKTNEVTYSASGPGTIDVYRLIRFQSYWKKNTQPTKLEKKSLVIKIAHDHLHVVDNYWLNYLLSTEKDPPPYQLDQQEILQSPHSEQQLMEVLTHSTPPLATIIHNEFSGNANKHIAGLSQQIPQIKIVQQPKKFGSQC